MAWFDPSEARSEHPDEGEIHAWLDDALSAEDAALVESHVMACAECREAVAEARGLIAASSRILSALDVPSGVVPVASRRSAVAPPRVRRIVSWPVRAIAATIVVAVGVVVVARRAPPPAVPPAPVAAPSAGLQTHAPESVATPSVPVPKPAAPALRQSRVMQAAPLAALPIKKEAPAPMPSVDAAAMAKVAPAGVAGGAVRKAPEANAAQKQMRMAPALAGTAMGASAASVSSAACDTSVHRDSLAKTDSLAPRDSTAALDSIARRCRR